MPQFITAPDNNEAMKQARLGVKLGPRHAIVPQPLFLINQVPDFLQHQPLFPPKNTLYQLYLPLSLLFFEKSFLSLSLFLIS